VAGNPCWTRIPRWVFFEVFHRKTLYVQFLAYLDLRLRLRRRRPGRRSGVLDLTHAKSVILERL